MVVTTYYRRKNEAGIYERTVNANHYPFKWNANLVLILKPGQIQLFLIFNYYFVNEDITTSYMEAVMMLHNLLSIHLH